MHKHQLSGVTSKKNNLDVFKAPQIDPPRHIFLAAYYKFSLFGSMLFRTHSLNSHNHIAHIKYCQVENFFLDNTCLCCSAKAEPVD